MFEELLEIQNIFNKYKNMRVAIEFASPLIGQFLSGDRFIIYTGETEVDQNRSYFEVSHEWCKDGVPSRYSGTEAPRKIYRDDIHKIYSSTFGVNKPFIIHRDTMDGFEAIGHTDSKLYIHSDMQSVIFVAITLNGNIWGMVGIHDIHQQRDFEEDGTITRLNLVANTLKSYITERFYTKESLELIDDNSLRMASLGRMAAGVAHEINNPIFIIGGFATRIEQLLEDKTILEKEDEAISSLNIIQKNCLKVTNIIEGLRLMSRNTQSDELEVLELNEVISRTIDICKERFQMENIFIHLELSEQELLFEGKPGQFSQVFTNLLNNSFDSLVSSKPKEERWVRVITAKDDSNLLLSVIDSGDKLSEELAKNIMEPFFTTKDPGKGTGLGLSICREIIKSYKGVLAVDQNCPNMKMDIHLPQIAFEEED